MQKWLINKELYVDILTLLCQFFDYFAQSTSPIQAI